MEALNQALFLKAAAVAFAGSLLVLAVEHRISAPWMPPIGKKLPHRLEAPNLPWLGETMTAIS